MRNRLLLLVGIIALYVATSLALHAIYGPSYPFLAGEDCWMPDSSGGWRAHGSPADSAPAESSVNVPLLLNYLPIFLPTLLLLMFWFTPLRRKLDPPAATSDTNQDDDNSPHQSGESE